MKCLLVDDEDGIREGLSALLRLRGHEVRAAADRASAMLLLAGHVFDVVITDWRLPDGNAHDIILSATCPVIAASGYPEEISVADRLYAVLQKPILPSKLMSLLGEVAALVAPVAVDNHGLDALPADVREVLLIALQQLDAKAAQVVDDGTFITLHAPWPHDRLTTVFEALGGDFRILAPSGTPHVVIRWCRDGRPDIDMPVVAADAPWPSAVTALAVDFSGSECALQTVQALAAKAASARIAGVVVHFLNLPNAVRVAIETLADRHFLPMKHRIGPRIPPALTELWS
ncbi:hypothetical protein LBMAG49_06810 [Planctomycetota bacterium]|nr:hypothetical protein LBMAG49_06810 [Planctomycetota bacterium]